jgi:hypothetical protein
MSCLAVSRRRAVPAFAAADIVLSGIVFGLAFYAAMYWVTGPLLGVKKPEWQADAATIGMHALNHVGFGLATAAGAKIATR